MNSVYGSLKNSSKYKNLSEVCSGSKTKHNQLSSDESKEIGKENETKSFILVPLTNREYVQSSCTSKRVHYNHNRLQMLKHTGKRLPMLKYTNKRLPNAQARRQETSQN